MQFDIAFYSSIIGILSIPVSMITAFTGNPIYVFVGIGMVCLWGLGMLIAGKNIFK